MFKSIYHKTITESGSHAYVITDDDFVCEHISKSGYYIVAIIELYSFKKLPVMPNIMVWCQTVGIDGRWLDNYGKSLLGRYEPCVRRKLIKKS